MTPLDLLRGPEPTVALIGAHCDDLELGAGGLLLELAAARPGLHVAALVLTSTPERAAETRAALSAFLPGADLCVTVLDLPDSRLAAHWDEVKTAIADFRGSVEPDVVVAPQRADAHQDHALVASLVPTEFRDHLVLGYEILKWDGDVPRPNLYLPLPEVTVNRKWDLVHTHYVSQRTRTWFDREAVLGLARVRGVECHSRYAEAFTTTKAVLSL